MDPLIAATATGGGPSAWWLMAAALAAAAAYALSCWLWPFRDCSVCGGAGSHRRGDDRSLSRPCWWCKGAGKRLRYGRRLWNRWRGR